ncbi:MAG: biotin synthase BioB [Rhodospirillaceae bacterium]|nr:biotin synthase BioB [Alphaproteobacteria bacterium]MBR72172.1 biotin synthase BioB [Rhodospirillaceae bacterium]
MSSALATNINTSQSVIRNDWNIEEVKELFNLPFNDLLFEAHKIHRQNFNPNQIQMSMLLSIKTGGCPEDCAYCPQSAHHETSLKAEKLMEVEKVLSEARKAKESGATRYCMGAAWRSPKDHDLDTVCEMISGVKALGMETCVTLGMLTSLQADRLASVGLDYYNHNIDTSPEFYNEIISTRTFEDRLDTLANVRDAGINVCSGGIVGMGENVKDRAGMLLTLANLPEHPQSVPINMLVHVEGTPISRSDDLDQIEFVKSIAVARILMPRSVVRLSAGREDMSDEVQALCYFAGANSIFVGDRLLTTANPEIHKDSVLFEKLGIKGTPIE